MDNNDSLDESQGSTKLVKGKRGVIWGNTETSALIKIWGEAEIKYALSSLKWNYEIFEMISTELSKIGFSRSAEECRTKTKSLRKLYKQAVLHNNTSGSERSKFIWFDEMTQIFRTDTSIHPLRTTESESAADTGTETMEGDGDVLVTLDLVELNDFLLSAGSDVSGTGHNAWLRKRELLSACYKQAFASPQFTCCQNFPLCMCRVQRIKLTTLLHR
ncbi:hypothetical protein JRQ81_000582 [Phrynocephalus forsythii]|uniref:Myb/SANT-like DNA-binding domain-containing protein n=1 Tax=Phrynocephalus forsythii TaxID=171643 RepID=A0A9Q0Y691_9SAUR|nr:hypothetical protein JRQ81_000582 [Phrynocephalus forsythii]